MNIRIFKHPTIVVSLSLICNVVSAQSRSASDTTNMSVSLNEIEVKANGLVVGHDKMMLNVDKNLRKHSHDGYSLLNAAMIPGLDVDPFDRTVKSENQDVLLCINGIKASQGEIRTINPKDVLRIDFYTGYDPRHPDSRFTLDFIVKVRDYGGAVVLEAMQHLNKLTGSDMADWRMFHGKTEFGVRLDENYDSYAQGKKEEQEMSLSFDRGDVRMTVTDFTDRNRKQSLRIKPYLIYRKKNETLKLTFALQQQHNRINETGIENYVRLSDITNSEAEKSSHSDRILPEISGMYQHKFSSSRYLNIFFNGNYSHTNKSRDYLSVEDVLSHTLENFYGGSATVQYSFGFSKVHRGFVSTGGGVNYSKIDYTENESASTARLNTKFLRLAIGDNWRVSRKLSLNLTFGGEIENVDNFNHKTTQFSLIPNLRGNWSITQGNTLNFNFSLRNKRPPMSFYSPDEKWVMPYIRQQGNPYLKMSRVTTGNVTYRNVRKWGYMELFASYTGTSKSVYYDLTCDNQRDVYIQTFRNGKTYHDLTVRPSAQFKIVPQHLTLRLGGEWEYVRTVTYKSLHHHTFRGNANLMFTSGGFSANVSCSTPTKNLSELGSISYVPWSLQTAISYNINNWYMGITVRNPFMTSKTWSKAELPGITEFNRFYLPRIRYNMIALTVGYRFGYGKPKKKYEDVELHENENSAILGL